MAGTPPSSGETFNTEMFTIVFFFKNLPRHVLSKSISLEQPRSSELGAEVIAGIIHKNSTAYYLCDFGKLCNLVNIQSFNFLLSEMKIILS